MTASSEAEEIGDALEQEAEETAELEAGRRAKVKRSLSWRPMR